MEERLFLGDRVRLLCGDCREVIKTLPDNSIDSVVTDPPYALVSIVKRFGKEGSAPAKSEGASGAYKRASAGFMGQSWDTGDVAFDAEFWTDVLRVTKPGAFIVAFSSTRTYHHMAMALENAGFVVHPLLAWIFASGFPKAHKIDAPGWEGWRYGAQALKPAMEPIFMGQKPFSEKNGTENILKYGVGALNIDDCRIHAEDAQGGSYTVKRLKTGAQLNATGGNWRPEEGGIEYHGEMKPGRWPANVLHDNSPEVLAAFPDSDGQLRSVGPENGERPSVNVYGDYGPRNQREPRNDSGSASRFFFAAKADSSDRLMSKHPTVKPLDLMQYLVRLVTPKGGTTLDPFAGSGTTGEAAWREGMRAILIERESEYQKDIARRMELADSPERPIVAKKSPRVEMGAASLFDGEANEG